MIYYVYLTECLVNGKYYIGQRKYEGLNIRQIYRFWEAVFKKK